MRTFSTLLSLALLGCLMACADQPAADETTRLAADEPKSSDAARATYHLMLGEMALRRGLNDRAVREFRTAAELSSDADLIERATTLTFALEAYEDARVCARRWLEVQPESLTARQILALADLREERVEDAVAQLSRLRERLAEEEGEPDLALLSLLSQESNVRLATEAMKDVVDEGEETPEGRYAVASLALHAGDFELAEKSARRAVKLRQDWDAAGILLARILVARGDEEAGLEQAAAVAASSEEPAVRLEYARLLVALGRYDEARGQLGELLEADPGDAEALRSLGLIELQTGQLESAANYFGRLVLLGDYDEAYFYLGRVAGREERYEDALTFYQTVAPGDYFLAAQLGISDIYREQGDIEGAREHLAGLANEFPEYRIAAISSDAELLADTGDSEGALAVYDAAIEAYPDAVELKYSRAFLLERLDRVEESTRALDQILAESPDDPTALNALGYILADRTDQYDKAYGLIRKALDQEPANAAIIDSMGWVLYRLGENEEALQYLRRAYILSRDPEVAGHLGEVLWALGDEEAAREIWRKALEENPDSEPLKATVERFMP